MVAPLTVNGVTSWKNGWQVKDTNTTPVTVLQTESALANVNVTELNSYTSIVFNRSGRVVSGTSQVKFKLTHSSVPGTLRCLVIDTSGKVNTTSTSC